MFKLMDNKIIAILCILFFFRWPYVSGSKAVVGGPAMAGPLFLPEMVLAGPHFWPNIFFQGRFLTFLLDLLE